MFNAQELLGSLVSAGTSQSGQGRMRHALGSEGLGGSNGLLGKLMGNLGGGGSGSGDMLGGLAGMAGNMMGDAKRSVSSGNPLAVGGLGALAGSLLGGGGGSLKGAMGGGALALLGSLALDALRNANTGDAGGSTMPADELPIGVREPRGETETRQLESKATLIIQAMANAAKADGNIDGSEIQKIAGKLTEQGADSEAREYVLKLLESPMDTEKLLGSVGDPQTAAEVYSASILAIEVDTAAERQYLGDLAQRLGLAPEVVSRIHLLLGVS